jgi:hypothetical protein
MPACFLHSTNTHVTPRSMYPVSWISLGPTAAAMLATALQPHVQRRTHQVALTERSSLHRLASECLPCAKRSFHPPIPPLVEEGQLLLPLVLCVLAPLGECAARISQLLALDAVRQQTLLHRRNTTCLCIHLPCCKATSEMRKPVFRDSRKCPNPLLSVHKNQSDTFRPCIQHLFQEL